MPAITKDQAPLAYAIYGISLGKHYLAEVKRGTDAPELGWKADDGGLGEYWAGNTDLIEAITDTAATQAAEKPQDGLVLPRFAAPASQQDAIVAAIGKLTEVHNFLLGIGQLDGMSFGDTDTVRPKARYWWRQNLMSALKEVVEATTAEQSSIATSCASAANNNVQFNDNRG